MTTEALGASSNATAPSPPSMDATQSRMQNIIIPRVDIDVPTPLDDVISTLAVLSREYDKKGLGVNFHVLPPDNGAPMPKIKLQNLANVSLSALVQMAATDAHYNWAVEGGLVALRPAVVAAGNPVSSNADAAQAGAPAIQIEIETMLVGLSPGTPFPGETNDKSHLLMALDTALKSQGADLISSPRIIVVSGTEGNITVGQSITYATKYGADAPAAGSAKSGGPVSIASATPSEFSEVPIGVDIGVTPTLAGNAVNYTLQAKLRKFLGISEAKAGDVKTGYLAVLTNSLEMATGGKASLDQPVVIPMGTFTDDIFSTTPPEKAKESAKPEDIYLIIIFSRVNSGDPASKPEETQGAPTR